MKLMRFFILQSGGVTDKDTAAYRSSRTTEIEEETSAVEVYLSDSLLQDNKLMTISTRAVGWRYSSERLGPASLDDQWWQR